MVYYNLESGYEGDVTKHCGLTIAEVDENFFELEDKYYHLCDEIAEKFDEIYDRLSALENNNTTLSLTVHDTVICPPGTSTDATYTMVTNRIMNIGGKIYYNTNKISEDGPEKGYRFGVAIQPIPSNLKTIFPDAEWYINETKVKGTVWDEIATNPNGWPEAMYLYPKIEEKITEEGLKVSLGDVSSCDNKLKIKIVWAEGVVEEYTYVVDENIELIPANNNVTTGD